MIVFKGLCCYEAVVWRKLFPTQQCFIHFFQITTENKRKLLRTSSNASLPAVHLLSKLPCWWNGDSSAMQRSLLSGNGRYGRPPIIGLSGIWVSHYQLERTRFFDRKLSNAGCKLSVNRALLMVIFWCMSHLMLIVVFISEVCRQVISDCMTTIGIEKWYHTQTFLW